MKLEDITHEMFDAKLFEIVNREPASHLLAFGDVYSIIAEEYNNQVLDELKNADPVDLPCPPSMTKGERVKMLGLDKYSFDYALPQRWIEQAANYLKLHYPYKYADDKPLSAYETLRAGVIWLYDDHGGIFGRPYPLTAEAKSALSKLKITFGYDDRPPKERK